MSDFLKKFLAEDPRRFQEGATRGIFLGAFGKHPGWDDHVEDLGLDTDSLILAKTLFYVQGIGSQIDSGEWEKLDATQQVPAFKHVFVWQRGHQYLIGRLWSSSDGKGRKRYPMIVCAHVLGASLPWALAEVLPHLEILERECQLATTAQDMRQLLDRHRQELKQRLAGLGEEKASSSLPAETLARFVAHPSLGPDQEGWHRLLYQMESQLHAYAPGQFNAKKEAVRPQQIRVPQCGNDLAESFRQWLRFFNEQVDMSVPLLLMAPVDESWMDVTLGEPTSQEFYSLRASAKKVPLVTEVPFNLDASFRQRARAFLEAFQRGAPQPHANAIHDPGTTTFFNKSGGGGGKSKWLKWLVGGAGLLIVLAIVMVMFSGPKPEESPAASQQSPPAPPPASGAGPGADQTTVPTTADAVSPALQPEAAVPPAQETEEAQTTRINAALEAQKQKLTQEEEVRRQAEAKAAAEAQAEAEAKRLAEEKARMIAEAEAARVKAEQEALALKAAQEKEAQRLAEAKRQAEEKARQEEIAKATEAARLQAEEEKRLAALAAAQEAEAKAKDAVAPATSTVPAATQATVQASGDAHRFMTNGIGLELVWMAKDFWAGRYEVTQAEFQKVMGATPSKFGGDPRRPVESVSWQDAMEFCRKLTAMEKDAGKLPAGTAYRLPTRDQWVALLGDASFDQAIMSREKRCVETSPVGSVSGNQWGLHDVLGNVWEWCLDDANAGQKMAMGGSFTTSRTFYFKPFQPTSSRNEPPDTVADDLGFRCVLVSAP